MSNPDNTNAQTPVVSINTHSSRQTQPKPRDPLYGQITTPDGKVIAGAAALMHIVKQNGGPTALLEKVSTEAAKTAVSNFIAETISPTTDTTPSTDNVVAFPKVGS